MEGLEEIFLVGGEGERRTDGDKMVTSHEFSFYFLSTYTTFFDIPKAIGKFFPPPPSFS